MKRVERGWLVYAAMAMVWACSTDEGNENAPCPDGVMAGQTVDCTCEDGSMSKATCQDDKTLTACDCGDVDGGTSGSGGSAGSGAAGGGSGGAGGSGGSGGAGGSGGTGGAAGSTPPPADDGGMPPTSDGGTEPTPIKTDGSMFALCADGTQCGFELDCYGGATGGGFCTTLCTEDADCESVGADYTCSSLGMCRQSCTGLDDDSCTNGLQCVMTSGGGGGGGLTFACAHDPDAGQPAAETFAECMGDQACGGGGQSCVGDTMTAPGFCSGPCMDDTDCADLNAGSGNLEPTCEFIAGGFMPTAVCALNCDGADAQCPDGMTCVVSMGPAPSHCSYE